MSENHKCDICGKPATVHLTQIVDNKVQKLNLCEACAQKKGVTQSSAFAFSELLAKTVSEVTEAVGEAAAQGLGLSCPECGMTPAEYKKLGRLGCPACYEALKPMIAPMLAQMQHDVHHSGKAPAHNAEHEAQHRRRKELEAEMALAVKEKRYKDAARVRDALAELASQEPGTPNA